MRVLIAAMFSIVFSGVVFLFTNAVYKQGQIDCATGKMQYELKKHEDGTTSWRLKGGE